MIDDKDLKIIELLQKKVTSTNKAIAAIVGMSDVGVANRINRLLSEGIIRGTIFYDTGNAGLDNYCIMELKVRDANIDAVAKELAQVDEFQVVARIVGSADLSVHFFARDLQHIEELRSKAAAVSGVHTIDIYASSRPAKFMTTFGTYAMLKAEQNDG